MVLSHKCSCGPSLTLFRNICIHSILESNHYKALGLTPSATHTEIKTAYYELSKVHHPDKNQGSEKSAKIFRDITEAYEILGNEKSRKQYDREQMLSNKSDISFQGTSRMDYNNDFEKIIFERTKRRKMAKRYGKTPHYDFDAWFRAHYGNTYQFSKYDYEAIRMQKIHYDFDKEKAANFAKLRMRILTSVYVMAACYMLLWIQSLFGRKK